MFRIHIQGDALTYKDSCAEAGVATSPTEKACDNEGMILVGNSTEAGQSVLLGGGAQDPALKLQKQPSLCIGHGA